ncbi:MAG: 6-phosphofructokinase [Planctomycetes bacterium]|nr:6-phosphofructokinase [Planctomycetota bacterium]
MAAEPNAIVGQSGGPTCVINQSLVGVIEAVRDMGGVGTLLGAVHGVRGVIDEKFIPLDSLDGGTLERIAETPSAALGSTRDKPDAAYCEKIFRVCEKRNVRYFFYIGGNDSADTARIVNDLAKKAGYELRVVHIPKTIDNDLRTTDHCPGYGSAARFVACALMGDDRDNASIPGVKIDVIMGRHAGWLTAATALGRQDEADGPHLIYLPERPVAEDQLVADVDAVLKKHGRCVVAASEGITAPDGQAWAQKITETQERDAHGNIQLSGSGALGDYIAGLVKGKLKAKRVRADTLGYMQRSFAGFASAVDQKEARLAGRMAVQYAMADDVDGSVAFERTGNGDKYGIRCFRTDLANVARETKDLPDAFIAANGHDVTKAFIEYAMPLTGGLPKIAKLF